MQLSSLVTLFLTLTISVGLLGCQKKVEETVVVKNMFIHELPPGRTTAAAYLTIENHTKVMQALNYVHSPMAENIELHRNIYENGMMSMRPVKKLSIAPAEQKILEPGGFHLMVMGIYDTLKVGDTFEVSFEFQSGLVVIAKAEVRPHG